MSGSPATLIITKKTSAISTSSFRKGCGSWFWGGDVGIVLDRLKPSHGVGVSISEAMVELATRVIRSTSFTRGDIEDPEIIRQFKRTI